MTARTTFSIQRMDWPQEERLIRLALDSLDGIG